MVLSKQWNIDLASTGANLQNVSSVTIGVEGSGSGVIYVDDLRLYAAAPAVATPVDPGVISPPDSRNLAPFSETPASDNFPADRKMPPPQPAGEPIRLDLDF